MITLTASAVLQYTVGGSAVETDDHAALLGLSVDWSTMQLTLTYRYGTWASPAFTPGQRAPALTLTVDLVHGGWLSSSGPMGNLTPAQLNTINSTLTNDRNTAETFAVTAGLLPGTQTPW
jgi:hypothetical protein